VVDGSDGILACQMLHYAQLQSVDSIFSIMQVVSSVADQLEAIHSSTTSQLGPKWIDNLQGSVVIIVSVDSTETVVRLCIGDIDDNEHDVYQLVPEGCQGSQWDAFQLLNNSGLGIVLQLDAEFILAPEVIWAPSTVYAAYRDFGEIQTWQFWREQSCVGTGDWICLQLDLDSLVLVYTLLHLSAALLSEFSLGCIIFSGYVMVTELHSFQGIMGVLAVAVTNRAIISDLHEVGLQGILCVR
jgi:hypothetical protein